MVDQKEYEQREAHEASKRLSNLRRAPLVDRREARETFFEAMKDSPDLVAERLSWLLKGNYGFGEMTLAKRVLVNKRMNRAAALTQMIAGFEWQCPDDFVRDAWKKLTKVQQGKLDRLIEKVIAEAEKENSDGAS